MKKLLFILIFFASCNSGAEKNELMTSFINKQKSLNDSLEYYNKIDANAKLSVDTLSDSDLLRVGSSFLDEQHKIRMELIPKIARLDEELKAVTHSIDSLSKMK